MKRLCRAQVEGRLCGLCATGNLLDLFIGCNSGIDAMSDFAHRRTRLRRLLKDASADAMLVTNGGNVRYLTGFTGGDSYLLVTGESEAILSDPRFEQQIDEECPGLPAWIRKPGEQLLPFVGARLAPLSLERLVVESRALSIADYDYLHASRVAGVLDKSTVSVEALREIKDATEIQTLRRAVLLAERVFTGLRAQLTSRHTEREVANWIEYQLRCLGAEGCSFPPIVAVGARAALPHAVPGSRPMGAAPFVLVDWGARLDGYCSDLTRVLVTSKIPAKFLKAYEVVLAAQRAAIAALRPGVSVAEVDQVAREVIAAAGMGKRFNHGLGHGIGLDIHESPRLGPRASTAARATTSNASAVGKGAGGKAPISSAVTLQPGMVVTIEPGVYFPEWGGIRIEDDVLITPTGCEILSSLSRELEDNRVELLA
jgi:Xaa-Pro aminopeptidase